MWGSFLIYHTMTSAFLCSSMTEKGELNVYRDRGVYNYLCNQCLSPLKLWVRTSFMARCTLQLYLIKFVCDLRQVSGFLQVLHVSFTNKTKCHSIAEIFFESGIKQHIPIFEKLVSNRCMFVSPLYKMCTRYKIMW